MLIKSKFNVNITVYYTKLKTGSYFQIKCFTPMHLISNVCINLLVRAIR